MKKFPKLYFMLFLSIGMFLTNCSNDDDIVPDPNPEQQKPEVEPETAADYPVQDFMWQAMNEYYFWQQDVPNLADNKFDSLESEQYVAFLASEENPNTFFFRDLCNNHVNVVGETSAVDRFSYLEEDYRDIVRSSQGVRKSDGLNFGLSLFGDNREVFGYVQYIIEGSDASEKDIKRGDIFVTVDGTQLFFNNEGDNNLDLLDKDTYTLGMATIENNTIVPSDRTVSLTKEEGLAENPILVNKIIERNGNKIGYISYNQFVANYDDELNEVFGTFKAENVSELILDFRYNPGGRVSSAVQIGSAVYGTKTDEVFLKARYNDKLQAEFANENLETNFTDETFDSKTPLNTLELTKVYVITSNGSASASELVINSLEPYVDVVQVGTTTRGKNEFSVTMVDDPGNFLIYDSERESDINPDNQWGIQPLLGRNENAAGFSDFTRGLVPDFELEEDIANLGALGEESDPLLALTLSLISGETAKRSFQPVIPVNFITNSSLMEQKGSGMVMDGLIKVNRTSTKK